MYTLEIYVTHMYTNLLFSKVANDAFFSWVYDIHSIFDLYSGAYGNCNRCAEKYTGNEFSVLWEAKIKENNENRKN